MTNHRKWISIEDRLPEEKETVIAATDRGYVYVAFLDYDHEWHLFDWDDWVVAKRVTHWMELPPAPGPTMTNADRIRAMTDEEMAVYLIKDVECGVARRAGWPLQNDEINRAICTCLIWLKQEVKDDKAKDNHA